MNVPTYTPHSIDLILKALPNQTTENLKWYRDLFDLVPEEAKDEVLMIFGYYIEDGKPEVMVNQFLLLDVLLNRKGNDK